VGIYIAIFEISINSEGLRQEFRVYSPKVSQNTNYFLSDAHFRPEFSPAIDTVLSLIGPETKKNKALDFSSQCHII
jgi:hypothetical protein